MPNVVRGASGDEWGELVGGKGTIGLQAAVPKMPHTRPLTFKGNHGKSHCLHRPQHLKFHLHCVFPNDNCYKLSYLVEPNPRQFPSRCLCWLPWWPRSYHPAVRSFDTCRRCTQDKISLYRTVKINGALDPALLITSVLRHAVVFVLRNDATAIRRAQVIVLSP